MMKFAGLILYIQLTMTPSVWCDVIGVAAESPTSWLVDHWGRCDSSVTYFPVSTSVRSAADVRQLSAASPVDVIHKLHIFKQFNKVSMPW